MREEISYLNQNKPELIVMFDPPKETYDAHHKMKENDSPQMNFINWVEKNISNKNYKLIEYKIFKNSIPFILDDQKIILNPFKMPKIILSLLILKL